MNQELQELFQMAAVGASDFYLTKNPSLVKVNVTRTPNLKQYKYKHRRVKKSFR